jgi:hypothetical protein
MKSVSSLLYLTLIFVSSLLFAVIYSSYKEFVEMYPVTFSVSLGTALLVGMYGIMEDIIFNTAHDK